MNRLIRKLTALTTNLCFSGCVLLTPCAQALADTCAQESSSCVTVNVGGTPVTYPQLALTPVATFTSNGSGGFNFSLSKGDRRQVDLNAAASRVGLPASQIAQVIANLPASSSMVFGRVSTLTGELDVTIFKVLRRGNNTTLFAAKFTPQMGNRWAASQTFMTASEKAGGGPGPNPFQAFEGGDQEFHNIPINSPFVAQTVVGMAARFVNAPIAVLNIAKFNERQWVTVAHHFFTTTTTTHDAGDESPVWFVGLPAGMSSDGNIAANYCLDALSGSSCATPAHQVVSGLAWSDWTTGNFPSGVATIHEFTESHTGFNFLTFILVVTSFAFGITGIVSVFVHYNEQHGDNVAKDLSNLAVANLQAVGTSTTSSIGTGIGAALGSLNYLASEAASGEGPFAPQNLTESTAATNPAGAFQAQTGNQRYFQNIDRTAMTAPVGQSSAQVDASGNNGFRAFSNFDQGYNNNVAPSANVNVQFNSMQYIQDTQ